MAEDERRIKAAKLETEVVIGLKSRSMFVNWSSRQLRTHLICGRVI